jgi:hypothetical protein
MREGGLAKKLADLQDLQSSSFAIRRQSVQINHHSGPLMKYYHYILIYALLYSTFPNKVCEATPRLQRHAAVRATRVRSTLSPSAALK